jgi:hypothetical protein
MSALSITAVHSLFRAKKYSEALDAMDTLLRSGPALQSFVAYRNYIQRKLADDHESPNPIRASYCLCLNATVREAEGIAELLDIWSWHARADTCDYRHIDLLIYIDSPSVTAEQLILRAVESSKARRLFNSVEVLSADVPPAYNFYKREVDGSVDIGVAKYGYKSGPNFQFFSILKSLIANGYKYSLLCETDCYPTSGRWLNDIFEEAARQEEFWALGSPYRGNSKLDPSICLHVNGVAVYSTGSSSFADLLLKWEQVLLNLADRYPNIAYDWALDAHYNDVIKNTHWDDLSVGMLKEYVMFRENFRYSRRIINLAGEGERAGAGRHSLRSIRNAFPGASLVHGNYFRSEALEIVGGRSSSETLNPDPLWTSQAKSPTVAVA